MKKIQKDENFPFKMLWSEDEDLVKLVRNTIEIRNYLSSQEIKKDELFPKFEKPSILRNCINLVVSDVITCNWCISI